MAITTIKHIGLIPEGTTEAVKDRTIRAIDPDGKGFMVEFFFCGHRVWWETHPRGKAAICSECLRLFVVRLRHLQGEL